ncbi:MAG: circularly permuted type 2 ATP-grasp protein [Rubripirellula sp.]
MPANEQYDEFRTLDGTVRPAWKPIIESFERLGADGMRAATLEVDRLVEESGANFHGSITNKSASRPWQLTVTPLVIPAAKWEILADGLQQRVRLLEAVLADLLGPQTLLKERVLPAELLSANPEYTRVYHELPAQGLRLRLTATDLARDKDGSWWVTGDRTRAPSGLGYALENRVITSRVFPKLIRGSNVVRLASFFASLQNQLNSLATRHRDNPRVAILTPGQESYRYVEDVYLARYLGYTLVQGRDLAVRGNRLNLKTLGGLRPIEVLLRHVSDRKCDPLELNPTSTQGVTGLLQTVRDGNVAVANSIGSSIAQMPALMPFLPAAAKFLLSEELTLPSIATYWCGGAKERKYVLEHLNELILRPAFAVSSRPPIVPAEMTGEQRSALVQSINADPHAFVAQQVPSRSTTPVWHNEGLRSWHVAVRSFQLQTDDGVDVLPGGLVRVSPDSRTLDQSPTSGRLGQDCWIVADEPVDQEITLLPASDAPVKLSRSGSELTSRVAENLFWLGRSAERTEAIARLLRIALLRIAGENELDDMPDVARLIAALAAMGQVEPDYAIAELERKLPELETILPRSLFDQDRPHGLRARVIDMEEKAAAVHDRISLDAYRVITKVGQRLSYAGRRPDAGLAINRLDGMLLDLQAFAGLASESMTRTHGWRFLQLGRRIERAYQTAELLSATLVRPISDERPLMESVLLATDSLMTYRSRYLLKLQPLATIDLLINDDTNPRSICFQLQAIDRLLDELPTENIDLGLGADQKIAHDMTHAVRMSDPADLALANEAGSRTGLNALLERLTNGLPGLSNAISAHYLIHTDATQQLTGRADAALPPGLGSEQ